MHGMRRRWWLLSGLLAVLLVSGALGGMYVWRELHAPIVVPDDGAWLNVPPGTPLARVSSQLGDRGLVGQPWLLTWYARLTGDATRIHAGEYQLMPGITPLSLLEKLVAGDVYLHQVAVIEGWRFEDMLIALRAHPAVVDTGVTGEEVMSAVGKPDVHPEGQFFPDTYRFPRGTRDIDLLRRAHAALERWLAHAWESQSGASALADPYQVLILASIIEKETGLASERRTISGVFHRRLQIGMRLQTDPTVIYGLGDDYQGRLRSADLARDTPYNTYTRAGLPPTPIALPGRASLLAAVDPEEGDALYFVATGLPDGSHYFSATLDEHNRAVQRYLQRRRAVTAD